MNITKENQSNEERELFIATLAHDLKNPILAQLNALELLSKGIMGKLTVNQLEIVNMIIDSTKNLKEMLYTMLVSYKVDNGNFALITSDFNIELLIQSCIKEIKWYCEDKSVSIKYKNKIPIDKNIIRADEIQIRRVISNLLNNSIKYAFKNTEIKITTEIINNIFHFSIENNSEEITKELQEQIFDKYITGKDTKHGTGLGLYFCKKIINIHGGNIHLTASNTDNKFSFTIPLK